jgi:heme o synthase
MTMDRLVEKASVRLGLCKVRVSAFAALSAATGFLLAGRTMTSGMPFLAAGVFLMACGAGALNHYQDRNVDALMARTAVRPLPAGKIAPGTAINFSIALLGMGYAVLLFTGTLAAPLLGLAVVILYNGFYTWFKKKSAYALIPGALIGAIPPAIGWLTAGGNFLDPRLGALCFLFLMWQIPHGLIHLAAFGREYEKIALPSLTGLFTSGQMRRLIFHWIMIVAVSSQLFIIFGLIRSGPVKISIEAASLGYVFIGLKSFLNGKRTSYRSEFHGTNYFIMTMMILLIIDRCLQYIRF